MPLNIATWNVRGSLTTPETQSSLIGITEAQAIDVWLIQDWQGTSRRPFPVVDPPVRTVYQHHTAVIIVNASLAIVSYETLDRITTVRLSAPGHSYQYLVSSVYAPAQPEARGAFFRAFPCSVFAESPDVTVLGGDWNATQSPYDRLVPSGSRSNLHLLQTHLDCHTMIDAWRFFHPTARQFSCHRNNGVCSQKTRIDIIYIPRNALHLFRSSSYLHVDTKASDHSVLILRKHSAPESDIGPDRHRLMAPWRFPDPLLFDRQFLFTFQQTVDSWPHRGDNFAEWNRFADTIRRVSENIWRTRQRLPPLSRLTDTISDLRVSDSATSATYVELSRHATQLASLAKSEKICALRFALNRSERWTTSLRCDNVTSYFSALFTPSPRSPAQASSCKALLHRTKLHLSRETVAMLEAPFTAEEVASCIAKISVHSASGPNGLTPRLLQTFPEAFASPLAGFLNKFGTNAPYDEEDLSRFSTTRTALVFKDKNRERGSDPGARPDFYRPITIANIDVRILHATLSQRLNRALESVYPREQTAFLPRRRASHAVLRLLLIIEGAKQGWCKPCVIVDQDQEKAYDRVRHDFLFTTMKHIGIPPFIINIYKTFYSAAATEIHRFGTVPIRRGLLQGLSSSCTAYLIAILPFLEAFATSHGLPLAIPPFESERISGPMYADNYCAVLTNISSANAFLKYRKHFDTASDARINKKETRLLSLPPGPHPWVEEFAVASQLPIDKSLDLNFLGRHFTVCGGPSSSVHNCILQATRKISFVTPSPYSSPLQRIAYVNKHITSLLNAVLDAGPIPSPLPTGEFEAAVSTFIWDGFFHHPPLDVVCRPIEKGGFGLIRLQDMAIALAANSAASILQCEQLGPSMRHALSAITPVSSCLFLTNDGPITSKYQSKSAFHRIIHAFHHLGFSLGTLSQVLQYTDAEILSLPILNDLYSTSPCYFRTGSGTSTQPCLPSHPQAVRLTDEYVRRMRGYLAGYSLYTFGDLMIRQKSPQSIPHGVKEDLHPHLLKLAHYYPSTPSETLNHTHRQAANFITKHWPFILAGTNAEMLRRLATIAERQILPTPDFPWHKVVIHEQPASKLTTRSARKCLFRSISPLKPDWWSSSELDWGKLWRSVDRASAKPDRSAWILVLMGKAPYLSRTSQQHRDRCICGDVDETGHGYVHCLGALGVFADVFDYLRPLLPDAPRRLDITPLTALNAFSDHDGPSMRHVRAAAVICFTALVEIRNEANVRHHSVDQREGKDTLPRLFFSRPRYEVAKSKAKRSLLAYLTSNNLDIAALDPKGLPDQTESEEELEVEKSEGSQCQPQSACAVSVLESPSRHNSNRLLEHQMSNKGNREVDIVPDITEEREEFEMYREDLREHNKGRLTRERRKGIAIDESPSQLAKLRSPSRSSYGPQSQHQAACSGSRGTVGQIQRDSISPTRSRLPGRSLQLFPQAQVPTPQISQRSSFGRQAATSDASGPSNALDRLANRPVRRRRQNRSLKYERSPQSPTLSDFDEDIHYLDYDIWGKPAVLFRVSPLDHCLVCRARAPQSDQRNSGWFSNVCPRCRCRCLHCGASTDRQVGGQAFTCASCAEPN